MRGEIRWIRRVAKYGAHGNPDAIGVWIYGYRPDGKTVGCKSKLTESGGIEIWSEYWTKDGEIVEAVTEFTAEEWSPVTGAGDRAEWKCNEILDARKARNRAVEGR